MTIPLLRRRKQASSSGGGGDPAPSPPTNRRLLTTGYDGDYVTHWDIDDPSEAFDPISSRFGGTALNTAQAIGKLSGRSFVLVGTDISVNVILYEMDGDGVLGAAVDTIVDINYNDCRDIYEDGDYFYAIFRDDDYLGIFAPDDYDTPTALVEVGAYDGAVSGGLGGPQQLCWSSSGRYLYAPCWDDNLLEVIDVQTPASPSRVGTGFAITGINNPNGICRIGDVLFMSFQGATSVVAIDVSTEAAPDTTPLGTLVDAVEFASITDLIALKDGKHIATRGNGKVQIINVEDPASMSIVGEFTIPSASGRMRGGVDSYDGYIYVATGDDDSVLVIDAHTDPTTPAEINDHNDATRLNDARGMWYFEVE